MTDPYKLSPAELIHLQDSDRLGFETTEDIAPFTSILGQEKAVDALRFGVGIKRATYNIYCTGESGTGRSSYIKKYLKTVASEQPAPSDWVYVNNFELEREPQALELPAGMAAELQEDVGRLIEQILLTFPAVFENPNYQQRKSAIERTFTQKYDQAIDKVEQESVRRKIALYRDAGTFSFTPVRDGKALDEAEFGELSESEREKVNSDIRDLEALLNDAVVELPTWKRESSERLLALNKETIDNALHPLMEPMEERYQELDQVLRYFAAMKLHLHRTISEMLSEERGLEYRGDTAKRQQLIGIYMPNCVVANDKQGDAPVIFESHPNYKNLFGSVEYHSEMGALVTDYRQIRSGALHRANGGYLILEAEKILEEPFVWEALKRALKSRQLKIESPYSDLGMLTTASLTPQIIPLDVKVALIGCRDVYYALEEIDKEFQKLFRILVDFDAYLERTDETVAQFARLLKTRAEDEGFPALTAQAVAALMEESSRFAVHKHRLSARIGELFGLLTEANYLRQEANDPYIERHHVKQAIIAKGQRMGRVSREIRDEMLDGTIFIDTKGSRIGSINGLTVLTVGDTDFGQPIKISAAVYAGNQGIVDIEREVDLGQAIHSKGVMILTGYLGAKYAQHFPLAISASLTMEQSYGYLDGDSASLAEICCLISALTRIALSQSVAITGSINQHGYVQPIGGVNEKIEGFFKICKARGLTGQQGVIIPASNVVNLMLREDVREAVKAKKFSIYAIHTVDQGLELLMERTAGVANSFGAYPQGTVNYQVVERLRQLSGQSDKYYGVKRRRES